MKLFVYGTLQQGYGNSRLLYGAKYLGEALTNKRYTLYNCGFPMAVPDLAGFPVIGQVWDVDEHHLASCDSLEGHPNWYRRTTIFVTMLEDKQEVTAMIYEMPKAQEGLSLCPLIPDTGNVYYRWSR